MFIGCSNFILKISQFHLSYENFQKVIKSLSNCIQIPTPIYFPFIYCHQGISVPRMTIEIGSHLVLVAHISSPIPCQSLSFSHLSTPSTLPTMFCPATEHQHHSLTQADLTTERLPMFSSKCSPISSTSYPKIFTRRVLMQPGCHSLWLLHGVCTYPVYMTLLCCEISLMH
jgi:hypothetical protein